MPDTSDNYKHRPLAERLAALRLVVLDVDGVLTDGGLFYDDHSTQAKLYHSQDGHGLRMLMRAGIEVAIVSGRHSENLRHRAENLEIRALHMGIKTKLPVVERVVEEHKATWAETAMVGDDVVDLPAMLRSGVAVAPADGNRIVRRRADIVTDAPGGRGAVREFVERVLKAAGRWEYIRRRYYV